MLPPNGPIRKSLFLSHWKRRGSGALPKGDTLRIPRVTRINLWFPHYSLARPRCGVFSHVGLPDSKTKKGKFTIKIVNTGSSITKGIDDFELSDELYYHLQMKPGVEPLATTDHDGGTWPVAWTRTYGRGRVFHTPLGHRDFGPGKDDPLRNPNLANLVIQGIDWVAEGKQAGASGK